MSQTPSKPEILRISPGIEHRDIAIVLGTGAEKLKEIGIDVGDPIVLDVEYLVCGEPRRGRAEVYDAQIGGVPVYLLSRHVSGKGYKPAYKINHAANMLPLVDEEHGAGAKVVLASSLVGGCRTTDWGIGDIVLVEDGIDMHAEDFYVDGNEHYVHAHGLFDGLVSRLLAEKAAQRGIEIKEGGVYYSGPDTTGNRFETPAEMARLLAPAYLRKYLVTIPRGLEKSFGDFAPSTHHNSDWIEPNLVGMTLVREAGHVRALSTRNRRYKEGGKKNKDLAKFAGFAVISDFPESEETDHETNVEIALGKLPVVMQIFAEVVPAIQKGLSANQL